MLKIPAKVIATCFALVGFAGAIAVGLAADNSAVTIVWRALIVMVIAWPVGRFVGGVAQRVCDDSIKAHKERNPIPDEEHELESLDDSLRQDAAIVTDANSAVTAAGTSA